MARKKEVTMGCQAKDLISGMKGTVTAMLESLSGTTQVVIHPPLGKGRGDEDRGIWCDTMNVEYSGEAKVKPVPVDDTSTIVLGSVYRDKVTGFEGTATVKVFYMTGCTQVSLQPKMTAKDKETGKLPDDVAFDWKRLEFVEEGVVKAPPKEITAPAERRSPGGPVSMSGRVA